MDRFIPRITLALIFAATTQLLAQSPAPSPAPSPSAVVIKPPASARMDDARRRFLQMSPQEQQKMRENLQKWQAMSKEERQALRLLAHKRRERLEQNVDEFVTKNGWTLDPERRKELIERFAQERKAIEDALRAEMEVRRRPMLRDMKERLKAEFAPSTAASPSPTPPSPTP